MLGKDSTEFFFIKASFRLAQLIGQQCLQAAKQSIEPTTYLDCIFFQQYIVPAYCHSTRTFPQRTVAQLLFELFISQLRETFFPQVVQPYPIDIGLAFDRSQIIVEFARKSIAHFVLHIAFGQQVLRTYVQQIMPEAGREVVFEPQQCSLDELSQFGFVLQFILRTRHFHYELKIRQRNHHFLLLAFHAIHLHQLTQDKYQLFLSNVPQLMQALHVVEVAFVEIGCCNALHIGIARGTTYLLNIIDKRTGGGNVVHTIDIADVHSHTKGLSGHNQFLGTFLELLHDGGFLFFLLFTVVRCHQVPVARTHPALQAHVDAAGKRIVKQSLMLVQIIFDPTGNNTLFGLVVSFAFFDRHLTDIETDVATLHRTYIQHTRFHL